VAWDLPRVVGTGRRDRGLDLDPDRNDVRADRDEVLDLGRQRVER
jgi:hypothetical protein